MLCKSVIIKDNHVKAWSFSKCVSLFYLLLLTIVVLNVVKTGIVVGQSNEHGDVTITVRPVTPVIENLTPKDFKFLSQRQ
jgi:uncharacterized protein (UPF0333 family)